MATITVSTGNVNSLPTMATGLRRLTRKESSAFASATGRFPSPPVRDAPAPGAYEAAEEWDIDRKRGWKPARSVFIAQDRRFKGRLPRDQVLGPGPGSYNPRRTGSASPTRGIVLSMTSSRFDPSGFKASFVPGPGAYNTRAELGKPSFNVTIDNP